MKAIIVTRWGKTMIYERNVSDDYREIGWPVKPFLLQLWRALISLPWPETIVHPRSGPIYLAPSLITYQKRCTCLCFLQVMDSESWRERERAPIPEQYRMTQEGVECTYTACAGVNEPGRCQRIGPGFLVGNSLGSSWCLFHVRHSTWVQELTLGSTKICIALWPI